MIKINEQTIYQHRLYPWIMFPINWVLITFTFWKYIYGYYGDGILPILEKLIYGGYAKPYVYRYLVPLIVQGLNAIYPMRLDVYTVLVMYLAALGFWLALRYLYTTFWQSSIFADLTIFMGVELLFILTFVERKIYDLSAAFLITLCLACLARRRMRCFALIFPLACLNKETTLFLTMFFTIYFWKREPFSFWIKWMIYQAACFGLIRLSLLWQFRHSSGSVIEYRLYDHFTSYTTRLGTTIFFFLFIIILIFWVFYAWEKKPVFLRWAGGVFIPMFAVSYLLFGGPFEIRVFAEVYPVVFLLAIQGLIEKVKFKPNPFVPPQPT